jgi:hypothetical protein
MVNSDQKTVDLLYATTTNYANGVSAEEPSPFLVKSDLKYMVNFYQ